MNIRTAITVAVIVLLGGQFIFSSPSGGSVYYPLAQSNLLSQINNLFRFSSSSDRNNGGRKDNEEKGGGSGSGGGRNGGSGRGGDSGGGRGSGGSSDGGSDSGQGGGSGGGGGGSRYKKGKLNDEFYRQIKTNQKIDFLIRIDGRVDATLKKTKEYIEAAIKELNEPENKGRKAAFVVRELIEAEIVHPAWVKNEDDELVYDPAVKETIVVGVGYGPKSNSGYLPLRLSSEIDYVNEPRYYSLSELRDLLPLISEKGLFLRAERLGTQLPINYVFAKEPKGSPGSTCGPPQSIEQHRRWLNGEEVPRDSIERTGCPQDTPRNEHTLTAVNPITGEKISWKHRQGGYTFAKAGATEDHNPKERAIGLKINKVNETFNLLLSEQDNDYFLNNDVVRTLDEFKPAKYRVQWELAPKPPGTTLALGRPALGRPDSAWVDNDNTQPDKSCWSVHAVRREEFRNQGGWNRASKDTRGLVWHFFDERTIPYRNPLANTHAAYTQAQARYLVQTKKKSIPDHLLPYVILMAFSEDGSENTRDCGGAQSGNSGGGGGGGAGGGGGGGGSSGGGSSGGGGNAGGNGGGRQNGSQSGNRNGQQSGQQPVGQQR